MTKEKRKIVVRVNWATGRALVKDEKGGVFLLDNKRPNMPKRLPAPKWDKLDLLFNSSGSTTFSSETLEESAPFVALYWRLRVAQLRHSMDLLFDQALDPKWPIPLRDQAVRDLIEMGAALPKLLALKEEG